MNAALSRSMARLDTLGLTTDEQVHVIDSGACLYAAGASPEMIRVFAKIAARGVLDSDNVAQLSALGIKPRISPQTAP